jgi:hypothetical protein
LPPEEVNVGLGLALHALLATAALLEAPLSCGLLMGGATSRVSMYQTAVPATVWLPPPSVQDGRARRPLFLRERKSNVHAFRGGLGLFNEALARVAHHCGVSIAREDACATLANLRRLLTAPRPAAGAAVPAPFLLDVADCTPPLAWLPIATRPDDNDDAEDDDKGDDDEDDNMENQDDPWEVLPAPRDWDSDLDDDGGVAGPSDGGSGASSAASVLNSLTGTWSSLTRSWYGA